MYEKIVLKIKGGSDKNHSTCWVGGVYAIVVYTIIALIKQILFI